MLLNGGQSTYAVTSTTTAGCHKPVPLLTPKDDTTTMSSLYTAHGGVPHHGCRWDVDPVDCATCAGDSTISQQLQGSTCNTGDESSEICFTTSSLYTAHGGVPHHGCRWDVDPVDCATCAGDSTQASTCNTNTGDDSEVCFTEELVRRKLPFASWQHDHRPAGRPQS